jgi:hypothetical protein
MSQDVMLRKRKVAAKTLVETGALFGESVGEMFVRDDIVIHHADALSLYAMWLTPMVIVSDGAYGLGSFEGDPFTPDSLADWYEPHVRAWSEYATPQTTLWFWNSELGWANAHPLLVQYGWRYVNCHVWDKGLSHVAGNSNTGLCSVAVAAYRLRRRCFSAEINRGFFELAVRRLRYA